MTHAQLLNSMSQREFIEQNVFHNPEYWRSKVNETDEGKSRQLLDLIMTKRG